MSKKEHHQKLVEQFAEAIEKSFEAMMKGDWRENSKWVKRQVKAIQRIREIGDAARYVIVIYLLFDKYRGARDENWRI